MRQNLVGTGFLDPPKVVKNVAKNLMMKDMNHRVTCNGEIVSVDGFQAQNTYIMFQILLPDQGWLFEDVNDQEMYGVQMDNHSEFNKRKCVTHTSQGRVDYSYIIG